MNSLRFLMEIFISEGDGQIALTPDEAEKQFPGSTKDLPKDPGVRLYTIDGSLIADVPGQMDSICWSENFKDWSPA